MSTDQPMGVCPSCGGVGLVGQACEERICQRKGMHFLPGEYALGEDEEPADALVGRRLGDYLVADLVGIGGFGRVYLALQQPIGLKAALKLQHTEGFPKELLETLRAKFEDEARALAVVQHPNVVRLLRYGLLYGRPYLVMEYVEGGVSLGEEIGRRAAQGRAFEPAELRSLFSQLLDGLEAAHGRGVIHRDVKPDNLMLQAVAGHPLFLRILDFGLAKFWEGNSATTQTLGTPNYMAPEQLLGRELGPWTDLYAVGVLFFELVTGRPAFSARTVPELIAAKLDPARNPADLLVSWGYPASVVSFLRRALAMPVGERFGNAPDMAVALVEALRVLEEAPGRPLAALSLVGLLEDASQEEAPPGAATAEPPPAGVEGDPGEGPGGGSPEGPAGQSDAAFRRWLEAEEKRLQAEEERLEAAARSRRR